jgi:hypothetical protein
MCRYLVCQTTCKQRRNPHLSAVRLKEHWMSDRLEMLIGFQQFAIKELWKWEGPEAIRFWSDFLTSIARRIAHEQDRLRSA